MACPKCDYPKLKCFAGGWFHIGMYAEDIEQINYCPNCGMELPTDLPADELDLDDAGRDLRLDYPPCG